MRKGCYLGNTPNEERMMGEKDQDSSFIYILRRKNCLKEEIGAGLVYYDLLFLQVSTKSQLPDSSLRPPTRAQFQHQR